MKTTANVRRTTAIQFWSSGKIAESAYLRINELRNDGKEDYAKVLLDEWII